MSRAVSRRVGRVSACPTRPWPGFCTQYTLTRRPSVDRLQRHHHEELGWMWVTAGTFGFVAWGHASRAASDPPPLEPPALASPGPDSQGRPGSTGTLPDIRRDGPPGDVREEQVGPAPGPDYFYIPGQYVPVGDRVTWRPGFWARMQRGWEWVPARWVRRSDGWTYREGQWVRTEPDLAPQESPRRHVVARPSPGPAGPFTTPRVDSQRRPRPRAEPLDRAGNPSPMRTRSRRPARGKPRLRGRPRRPIRTPQTR